MEFTQYKCPVCKKQFEPGDDVVVCPECGAPHHRECYEKNGKCFYEDKHSEDFSFEKFETESGEDTVPGSVCPVCRLKNAPGSFFCNRCGSPLNNNQANNRYQNPQQQAYNQNQNYQNNQYNRQNPYNQNPQYGQNQQNRNNNATPPPFGFGASGYANFDPLAGLNAEEEITDGIKVGEMSKFVGKNTNYFLFVFDRIRKFARSKFNFCAFIFSGVYFLYRKMYLIGVIFALVMIGTNLLSTYIMFTPEYNTAYQQLTQSVNSGSSINSLQYLYSPILYIPTMLNFIRYGIMFFSGFMGNRLYLKHCKKRIGKIKDQSNGEDISDKLSSKGGVNLAIALSFGISIIAISLICEYIMLSAV